VGTREREYQAGTVSSHSDSGYHLPVGERLRPNTGK